jgi:hypothetical protein
MTISGRPGKVRRADRTAVPPRLTTAGAAGGLRGMSMAVDAGERADFERQVAAVLARFVRQQGAGAVDGAALRGCAARLVGTIEARGLPPPLAPGECGSPGGMAETDVAARVAEVLGDVSDATVADGVKQLVKACFYPEFTVCRDSYRELTRDGACRRQDPARVRGRISGTHCVDCPYWVALEPEAHAARLAAEWVAGPEALARDREMFLPEDFRGLRRWLWRAARAGRATGGDASSAGGR